MPHYTQYLNHHVDLLKEFSAAVQSSPPFTTTINDDGSDSEENHRFIETLEQLCQMTGYNDEITELGQWFVARVVSAYSHLMPLLNRDLLWFFGGNCLHYMPDEEIAFYQQLDELRYSAEEAGHHFDYAAAKQSLTQPQ